MTAQTPEILRYKGETVSLCAKPLEYYFELTGVERPFSFEISSALWRGYIGTWEIIDDRLYLVGLEGWGYVEGQAGLAFLFPDFPIRVFAHWVNGTLRATRGEMLDYVHGGFGSTFEEDTFFEFRDGVLKSVVVKDNRIDQTVE